MTHPNFNLKSLAHVSSIKGHPVGVLQSVHQLIQWKVSWSRLKLLKFQWGENRSYQLAEPPKILPKNCPGKGTELGKTTKRKTLQKKNFKKKMLLLGFSVDGEHSAPETRVWKGGSL